MRDVVQERSLGLCEMASCGRRGEQMHHRNPRRMGGRKTAWINSPANLVHLCGDDHRWVESNRRDAMDLGLILHADEVPSEVLVNLRYGPVYLDDQGGMWPVDEDGTSPAGWSA